MASPTHAAARARDDAAGQSHLMRSLRVFVRTPANIVSALVILAGVAMVFVPTAWLPHDPTRIDILNRLQGPSWSLSEGYFFGTDALGRDVLSRVVFAARWTFLVSASAAALACVIGSLAGLVAGYFGGHVDGVISRLIDMQLAFPVILLALSVLAVAGPSLTNMILVLVLVDWARYARVVRSAAIAQRTNAYVEAAAALGASHPRIMLTHLLPNLASTVLVMATFSTSLLLLTESALSFLGLGVSPPAVTWGGMIGAGRDYIYAAWWVASIPGIVITSMVLAINWIGDGLRDAFDPRER